MKNMPAQVQHLDLDNSSEELEREESGKKIVEGLNAQQGIEERFQSALTLDKETKKEQIANYLKSLRAKGDELIGNVKDAKSSEVFQLIYEIDKLPEDLDSRGFESENAMLKRQLVSLKNIMDKRLGGKSEVVPSLNTLLKTIKNAFDEVKREDRKRLLRTDQERVAKMDYLVITDILQSISEVEGDIIGNDDLSWYKEQLMPLKEKMTDEKNVRELGVEI